VLTRELMSEPVVTVRPRTPAKAAIALLAAHGFTALPVVDDGRLVGVVTESDLLRGRVVTDARTSHAPATTPETTVGAVMTRDPRTVAPNTDVAKVARLMLDERLRSVPVLENGLVVGVVTRRDLLRVLARDDLDILADVRRRLAAYGGRARWAVTVSDGAVTVVDDFDDAPDRHVARVLAESVPGVQAVTVTAKAS
jgi:CBS domain-containing protein